MSRAVAVAVLVVLVLLVWGGMYAGWRRRGARQVRELALPPLPVTPPDAGTPLTEDADGVYVSSTTAGDWLNRVTASGLGARSAARMAVTTAGVTWLRQGAPDVFAAAGSVLGARRADGIAGKVVPPHGIVVVTWRLGEVELDTGFRPRTPGDGDRLVSAARRLAATTHPEGVS